VLALHAIGGRKDVRDEYSGVNEKRLVAVPT